MTAGCQYSNFCFLFGHRNMDDNWTMDALLHPSRYACFLIEFGQFEGPDKFCQSRVDPESRKSFA
jgi:hypothetical protein